MENSQPIEHVAWEPFQGTELYKAKRLVGYSTHWTMAAELDDGNQGEKKDGMVGYENDEDDGVEALRLNNS